MSTLLSKQTIDKIMAARKERGGDIKPSMDAGEHMLTLTNVELKNSKKNNDVMLCLEMSGDEAFRPLAEVMMLSGTGAEVGLDKVVNFLASAFGHEPKECKDEKELLREVLAYKGQKFKAAVRIQEEVYIQEKDGVEKLTTRKKAQYWYAGRANDAGFRVDIAKAHVPMSAEDKKKYLDWKKEHENYTATAEELATAREGKEEPSDLPF